VGSPDGLAVVPDAAQVQAANAAIPSRRGCRDMSMEARPEGTDAFVDEPEELRQRVWQVEERLFLMEEVPVQSPFTIDVMFDRLEELAVGLNRFAYAVDLTGVQRPDAPTRQRLHDRVTRINARLAHVGVAVGGNVIIRAVAKLAAFAIGFRSVSFHMTADEALEACRRALR
jgi:hypothetical protein